MPLLPLIHRRPGVRAEIRESTPHRLLAEIWAPPGTAATGRHSHPHQDTRLDILEGLLAVEIGGVERVYGPGDSVTVRRGVKHDVRNPAGAPLHYRIEFSPGLQSEGLVTDVFRGRGLLRSLPLLWRYRHEVRPALST